MRDHLVFYLNGARQEVRGPAVGMTVTDYLRYGVACRTKPLTGTKVACAEGDCGACTVLVGRPSADGARLIYNTIDACIAFVYQLDHASVVTVEGIADADKLSTVQQAMVDCHGSQCGFCTPGFVMALHGLQAERPGQELSDEELRIGLSGNLCRCTGYTQILEAAHAVDAKQCATGDSRYQVPAMLEDLVERSSESARVNPAPAAGRNGAPATHVEAVIPATLADLLAARAENPDAKLVAGATDLGVQHNHGRFTPESVIVASRVAELMRVEKKPGQLTIGAAVTWDRVEQAVVEVLPEFAHILSRFGSPQVRHAGTMGGNLANASPIADSIPLLYAAGATLQLASLGSGKKVGTRSVEIQDFYLGYKQLDLRPDEIIESINLPLPAEGTAVKLYKVSKRRDMDISTVTAAFWMAWGSGQVKSARVALGGVGPTVVRAPAAEAALTGATWSLETCRRAGRAARGEVHPISDVRGAADYRLQLVENLFAKCFHDLSADLPASELA
ncbi:4-hydroxybenzoyl-CoA reductase subunit gamma [Posidoniimonas polymericola]|uniref:4-hydroxybenzoyl-CoA reductase subunit gamma n=1 Tax=Posidoniimonas polymericola TaxID=2528002 RepID=A0A5C5YML1_9BACT|nr:xanthine dehydrogenase small subunit [Posidoniimonas polymericola]TWT76106.1 4-hydroxybenzoyl-CoA reductase subunit gamma [Posidoniimonas polymericola]